MIEEATAICFFSDISEEDMRLIFTTRLPYAIRRSEPFHEGRTGYKIVGIKRIEEQREKDTTLFVRIDVNFQNGTDVASYYFRVYPNKTN